MSIHPKQIGYGNKMKTDYKPSHLLEYVLWYPSLGWRIIPIHTISDNICTCGDLDCQSPGKHPLSSHGVKDATNDLSKIKSWWEKWPDANIGIATGKRSGIVALDIDYHSEGEKSLEKLLGNNELPVTIETITGGRGRHIFFKHPGDKVVKNKVGLNGYPGIDIRADEGYIVAPPSLHISGERYEFENSKSPSDVGLADLPPWLLRLLPVTNKLKTELKPQAETGFIPVGRRNNTLTKIAGSLRRDGLDQPDIYSDLSEINKNECKPPLQSYEVDQISRSIAKYPPAARIERFHHTDLGNSEMMAALYGEDLKFCSSWKKWLVWDGTKWAIDEKRKIYQKATQTIKQMYRLGTKIKDPDKRSTVMKHVVKTEAVTKIRAMIELASSHSDIAVSPDELDIDPWLLNAVNGVIDLKTIELKSHDKKHLITKIIPVEFNERAQCNRWLQFLDEVIGNKAAIDFIQLAIGCSLTGIQKDHKFFILYGNGANGKSTFLNTILKLLGDYGIQTPTETLLIKHGGSGISNDIACLKGARFVSAVEAQEGRRLNETLIKQLTGGDPISARFLYAENFTFNPQFKLWLGTNHKPVIRENTHAIWRRICLIPFTNEIPSAEQDKELQEKLKSELPGILNWALEGCLRWQKHGLPDRMPQTIDAATTTYRTEMDVLSSFLNECCMLDPEAMIGSSELYGVFSSWCKDTWDSTLTIRGFAFKLKQQNFEKVKKRQGSFWLGIKLK